VSNRESRNSRRNAPKSTILHKRSEQIYKGCNPQTLCLREGWEEEGGNVLRNKGSEERARKKEVGWEGKKEPCKNFLEFFSFCVLGCFQTAFGIRGLSRSELLKWILKKELYVQSKQNVAVLSANVPPSTSTGSITLAMGHNLAGQVLSRAEVRVLQLDIIHHKVFYLLNLLHHIPMSEFNHRPPMRITAMNYYLTYDSFFHTVE
jgi:hypothetical protein